MASMTMLSMVAAVAMGVAENPNRIRPIQGIPWPNGKCSVVTGK